MKRFVPLLFAASVVLSCTDEQAPTTSPFVSSPVLTEVEGISDGNHEGNNFFFWLPELVESPAIPAEMTFNPKVPASVRICELGEDPNTASSEMSPPGVNPVVCVTGTDVALFGPADITVTDDELSQQYSVVWKTDDPISYPVEGVDPDKFYRLSVWVGEGEHGQELGYRYLDPEASPPSGSGAKLERFYPFKFGNTINIKFWIGNGAFCLGGDPANCGECFYTESGPNDGNSDVVGRACTVPNETAGVFINSETPEIDGVLIVVEYIPTDAVDGVTVGDGRTLTCYADPDNGGRVDFIKDLDIPQYGQCFVVTPICTRADGCPDYFDKTELNLQAVVGSCPLIPDEPELHPVLHRTDDANNPTFVQALKPASSDIADFFLNCEPSFASLTPLQKLAWAWNKVSPFSAAPAYADHRSLKGAEAPSFSDFVWAVPSQEEKAAGDNQVGLAGTTLPDPLVVRVTDLVPSDFWDGGRNVQSLPVEGAEVTLGVPATESWGAGGLSLPVAGSCPSDASPVSPLPVSLSDSNGEVSVCVTLPDQPGKFHIEASGYGIGVKELSWDPAVTGNAGTGPYSHYATSPVFSGGPITLPKSQDELDKVAFEVTACQPGFGTATADGILEPNEYQCSEGAITFEANVGGGKKTGFIYRMMDGDNLYFAVAIPVDEQQAGKVNTLTLYLNTDGDSELLTGHDVLIVDGTLPEGEQFSDNFWTDDCPKGQSFCAVSDTSAGGSKDGAGGFRVNSGENGLFYFYEIQHSLNSGDLRDIYFTETLHAFFTIRGLGKGAKGDTEFPGPFGAYDQLEP